MDLNEFNDKYGNKLLDNITKENKTTFLQSDFNIDLLKSDSHTSTNELLDSVSSNLILPYILHSYIQLVLLVTSKLLFIIYFLIIYLKKLSVEI